MAIFNQSDDSDIPNNSVISRLSQIKGPSVRRQRHPIARAVERCEARILLTVTTLFDGDDGELHVSSDAGDTIVVDAVAGEVTINGVATGVPAAGVRELDIKGGPAANAIDVSGVTVAKFLNLLDVDIDAFGGNDTVTGSEFDDDIRGGAGSDSLNGSGGSDRIVGGSGNDDINGGDGDDLLLGRSGNDSIRGGLGNDRLRGQGGADELHGGLGDDSLIGNIGSDLLTGEAGDDLIIGGGGSDLLTEAADADLTLTNRSLAGAGSDRLRAIESASLTGGFSSNTISAAGFSGSTTLDGGAGSDSITGSENDDSIIGSEGDDTINGGLGSDDIDGRSGNDNLAGGAGDDVIRGGTGSDSLHGDEGDDDLHGEDDDDILHGGLGDDFLRGGSGVNLLDGDEGFDDEDDGFSGDLDEEILAALVNTAGTVIGRVEFEQSPEHGDTEVELEILITNAAPGIHDITLDGVVIGQLTVSINGAGVVEYSNQPDDPDELLLPEHLPAVTAGATISVGAIASGTFRERSELPSVPLGGTSAASPGSAARESGIAFAPSTEFELEGRLSGTTLARGVVEFDREFEHGVLERKFEVEIVNAPANALLDVRINGVLVGQIQTDFQGQGELELSSHPDDLDEWLLPTDFIDPQVGDIVTIDTIMSAKMFLDD